MTKIITKTSAQAKIERAQREKDTSCPECGKPCLGSVATRTKGIFSVRVEKKYSYSCIYCDCEWTTGWK
ncbi:hypothetical protein P4493_10620 [Bacillus thuringiensis]|uniref:Uncharacterized protein n=3 Tax=Bacillus thuringiensis TaxID=1428 RepID=A0AB35PCW1_BACTU|nr:MULTISPECIES: hypothetical protein [Bacillus]MEC3432563.1 hypothetical protein [Bacillus cereus]AFQ30285.1 hypothetical protein BTF1_30922 [Bacillus thuringiensis HD-789]AND28476.1 hypothetical protein ATN07_32630 [Bacillus thuringiensis serovar israelensis]EXL36893.1 hypothetical protein BG78_23910 [Bacillus thuringiensis serovar israelensis]KAA8486556.1 hypothetical protein FYW98_18290 [Bacillus thuringiensis]